MANHSPLETGFDGSIFQVLEALDYGDAVSNQAIALDALFQQLGFSTAIFSRWHHDQVSKLRQDLELLKPTDKDLVIFHFVGYSVHAVTYLKSLRCTKICVYHNITPHSFFRPDSSLYRFCLQGRQQLSELVEYFHYFWGDSAYNLEEIIQMGVSPQRCAIVPIVVPLPEAEVSPGPKPWEKRLGNWIFIGRITPNKQQTKLVELFAQIRSTNPSIAQTLFLVGGFNSDEPYVQTLTQRIEELGLAEQVVLTGKVSNHDLENYLSRSFVYVSMSEHEGFGVPLIESAHRGIPVVALDYTAVGETMGGGPGVVRSPEELKAMLMAIATDSTCYEQTVDAQRRNAQRFTPAAVERQLVNALMEVVPHQASISTVSVVICTYNRADLLERCLEYLQFQTNQNFEVVVINGPSTDHTEAVISAYADRIKYGVNSERNLSKSRNLGIELAVGDIIAFIDDDALPFDDWVETLIREFRMRPLTMAALGGPVYYAGTLEFQAEDIGINCLAETQVSIESHKIGQNGWERSLLGTNTSFRADILRQIGGFDEQFDYFLDESELCFRLQKNNYLVSYCPELFVRHEFAQSPNRMGKHNYNWFSICKNTAYFIAAYSGLADPQLSKTITKKIHTDRIVPLQSACSAGTILKQDYEQYVAAIESGIAQGRRDFNDYPKTRKFEKPNGRFHRFCSTAGKPQTSLHICIITKEFPGFAGSGGIGTLYYHLASELLLMGHHVTIVVPGQQGRVYRRGRFSVCYAEPCAVFSMTSAPLAFVENVNWAVSAFHVAAKIHSQRPIDVIDSALWDTSSIAFGLLRPTWRPPLVLRLVTPFVTAARLNDWKISAQDQEFFKQAEVQLIQSADAVVPISQSIATTVEVDYDQQADSRWILCHCGIAYWPFFDCNANYAELSDLVKFDGKPLVLPATAKVVLFVGRLEGRKGVDILLHAANVFLQADPEAWLILAGRDVEGWTIKAKSLLSREVSSRVAFLGEVDDLKREKLLHTAYCLVFPSRYESFGLVPLESFVHGVPVIASSSGAIPEVVVHEECGLLFSAEDVSDLAACVVRLLTDKSLREKLSLGSIARVKKFSSRNSALRTVNIYQKLAKRTLNDRL
jgi:hypothetical protein